MCLQLTVKLIGPTTIEQIDSIQSQLSMTDAFPDSNDKTALTTAARTGSKSTSK